MSKECKECKKRMRQLKLFWKAIEVLKKQKEGLKKGIKLADEEIERLWDDIELR